MKTINIKEKPKHEWSLLLISIVMLSLGILNLILEKETTIDFAAYILLALMSIFFFFFLKE